MKEAYILMRDTSGFGRRGYRIRVILRSDHFGSSLRRLTYHYSLWYDESLNSSNFIDHCESLGIEFLKIDDLVMQKEYHEAIESGSRKRDKDIMDIVASRKK